MAQDSDEIVREFSKQRRLYEDFERKISELIQELLRGAGIVVHSVSSRTKKSDSLSDKLKLKPANSLVEITDLVGVRVITHFPEDVDAAGSVIEGALKIDTNNSVDKRKLLDPDRFGYLSLHYVVSLDDVRARLAEYTRFARLKCEIQVRSILQHAWAEIEHDLGYKASVEVPATIRRRFFRVAGLLEIADQEFSQLKNDLTKYRESLKDIRAERMSIPLDLESLRAVLEQDTVLDQLLEKLGLTADKKHPDVPGFVVQMLHDAGIRDLDHLIRTTEDNLSKLSRFLKAVAIAEPLTPKSVVNSGFAPLWISIYHATVTMTRGDLLAFLDRNYLDSSEDEADRLIAAAN